MFILIKGGLIFYFHVWKNDVAHKWYKVLAQQTLSLTTSRSKKGSTGEHMPPSSGVHVRGAGRKKGWRRAAGAGWISRLLLLTVFTLTTWG